MKANRTQMRPQDLLCAAFHLAKESQCEMNLFRLAPADSFQSRIQPNECGDNRFREIQTNEKLLPTHRADLRFVVLRDRRLAETRDPFRHVPFLARFPTRF